MEIVQVNSIKAWLLAARPKTLAGAATPVLLGCVESGRRPLSSNSELAKNLLELYEVNLEDVI